MAKYNFFISYSVHDGMELGKVITARLRRKGYTVWSPADSLPAGTDFTTSIVDVITNCDFFLPIVTEGYTHSVYARDELEFAISKSTERAKKIIPLICTPAPLPPKLLDLLIKHRHVRIQDKDDIGPAIEYIDRFVGYELQSALLYETLAEYEKLKQSEKEAEIRCRLIDLLCGRWETASAAERRRICLELCRLLQQLGHYCGSDDRQLAHKILDTLRPVSALLPSGNTADSPFHRDLFFAAFAIRLTYWDREVRSTCVDMITGGEVRHGFRDPYPVEQYIEIQAPYVQAYRKLSAGQPDPSLPADELDFVAQSDSFILSDCRNGFSRSSAGLHSVEKSPAMSEEEDILLSVAKFMQEGNKLFDELQKHGIAGDFLKCLLTSYERLKNYCQIVGADGVAAECVDRIVEIRHQLDKQEGSGAKSEKAENGIKSLLGFTLNTGSSYDVFISFKSEDSDLAQKVYQLCQRHLKVPFWSKRTLPELSKSEYEKAIYQALDNSTHFVVVLSDLRYLEADWIIEEMRIFHREKSEGRKAPHSNFIFVVTDSLYDAILRNNKKDLPIEYRGYQIIKMSEYDTMLLQYIN